MTTPFDDAIAWMQRQGYHNHRRENHSDIVSQGIYRDLLQTCDSLRQDAERGTVKSWLNVPAPGARERRIDLFVGETHEGATAPELQGIRIAVENKSVVTAHRNKDARFDDLEGVLTTVHAVNAEAVLVATVMIGVAERYLNIPDRVRPLYGGDGAFQRDILPRLSKGEESLWTDFPAGISVNKIPRDPIGTLETFREIKRRHPGRTHEVGYDYLLFVPVLIDNVNPPIVARENPLGIDVDADYREMLAVICKAYRARWHL